MLAQPGVPHDSTAMDPVWHAGQSGRITPASNRGVQQEQAQLLANEVEIHLQPLACFHLACKVSFVLSCFSSSCSREAAANCSISAMPFSCM